MMSAIAAIVWVSILARSGDRALRHCLSGLRLYGLVSILARSGDRALHIGNARMLKADWFQSSPGLVTGRYKPDGRGVSQCIMFQSSPGLVTGRYPDSSQPAMSISCFNPRPVW